MATSNSDESMQDVLEKLEEIRKTLHSQLALYRLVNAEAIDNAHGRFLNTEPRKKIFALSDDKHTVTGIAQEIFHGEPVEKCLPKLSYHPAILEEYGFVEHRDEKGLRYYRKRE